MHSSIPQLALVPEPRTCPPWCTEHDADTNLCIGTRTDLTYPAGYPSGVTLTSASVQLMQDPDETQPTIALTLNSVPLDLAGQQAENLALALLRALGKAGL
ncbi:hypothetical protein Caci_2888 [Catenulispora acidiphila DSM 44928]|uniref:Uncharacterized protein n=1 Tax=Catenulispora acidiphila (strain DSM 44928 / JCM 14897 / NBRC 102108 / NRRL B-24433 / ID139908) TaxID=479433 RepID=C7Q2Q5_CATAD|nr:hypothetical protein [Catenulispora acidiphila]ACU71797.1 hypothetical protein Caci_2888 [Catenulispora acidiphila DSM 44928]